MGSIHREERLAGEGSDILLDRRECLPDELESTSLKVEGVMDVSGITSLFPDSGDFRIMLSLSDIILVSGSFITIVLESESFVTIVLESESFVTIVLESDSFIIIVPLLMLREITVLSPFNGCFFPSTSGFTNSEGCRGTTGAIACEARRGDG
mgnify:CR=1 FL=1